MIRCTRCNMEHRGPRTLVAMQAEAGRVLARSLEMDEATAGDYLRTQWMGGALELRGICPSCVLTEIAVSSAAVVAATEEALQAASGETHVCVVIPMRGAKP